MSDFPRDDAQSYQDESQQSSDDHNCKPVVRFGQVKKYSMKVSIQAQMVLHRMISTIRRVILFVPRFYKHQTDHSAAKHRQGSVPTTECSMA